MSYKDPEAQREYYRQWVATNADRVREYQRQYRVANGDRLREYERQYRAANADRIREYGREYQRQWRENQRRANPEQYRARRERNMESQRTRRYKRPKTQRRDSMIADFWRAQGGICYLGGEPLALENAILEHDHRCCPAAEFCPDCVRGAACKACNSVAGLALDDPDKLRRIADALDTAKALVTGRLGDRNGKQLALSDMDD